MNFKEETMDEHLNYPVEIDPNVSETIDSLFGFNPVSLNIFCGESLS